VAGGKCKSIGTSKVVLFSLLQLCVRAKNTKERLGSLWKGFSKSFDAGVVLKSHKDVDPWFEAEKTFLDEYHNR